MRGRLPALALQLGTRGARAMGPEREQHRRNPLMAARRARYGAAGGLMLLAMLAGWVADAAQAETCLSPFVKRLDRPEKFLYVFCLDADARDHDFLAVIDVDLDSPQYGKLIYQLDLGSSGNETHHFGFTD